MMPYSVKERIENELDRFGLCNGIRVYFRRVCGDWIDVLFVKETPIIKRESHIKARIPGSMFVNSFIKDVIFQVGRDLDLEYEKVKAYKFDAVSYVDTDVQSLYPSTLVTLAMNELKNMRKNGRKVLDLPKIERVLFNKPATIVFWADGTKTVVKAQKKDKYDKEKGLVMAIAKKVYGNDGKYYNNIKKHLED